MIYGLQNQQVYLADSCVPPQHRKYKNTVYYTLYQVISFTLGGIGLCFVGRVSHAEINIIKNILNWTCIVQIIIWKVHWTKFVICNNRIHSK